MEVTMRRLVVLVALVALVVAMLAASPASAVSPEQKCLNAGGEPGGHGSGKGFTCTYERSKVVEVPGEGVFTYYYSETTDREGNIIATTPLRCVAPSGEEVDISHCL
jgi:hypothetical protein